MILVISLIIAIFAPLFGIAVFLKSAQMKKFVVIAAVLFVIGVGLQSMIFGRWESGPLTTREIMRMRIEGGPGALFRYEDRTVLLEGVVQRVILNYDGDAVIVLDSSTSDSDFRCAVTGRPPAVMALQAGQRIQIEGANLFAGTKMGSFKTCRFVATVNR